MTTFRDFAAINPDAELEALSLPECCVLSHEQAVGLLTAVTSQKIISALANS